MTRDGRRGGAASVLAALALALPACRSGAEAERAAAEREERERRENFAKVFEAAANVLGREFNLRVADPYRGFVKGTYPKEPDAGAPGQIREWVYCVVRYTGEPLPRIEPDARTGGNLPAEPPWPDRAVESASIGEVVVSVTVMPVHGKRRVLSHDMHVESRVFRDMKAHGYIERRLLDEIGAEAARLGVPHPYAPEKEYRRGLAGAADSLPIKHPSD